MKVVGYLRVSTEEQEQSGLGLEDQAAKINSYCDLYELELATVRMDIASGKAVHNRDGLQEALAMLKKGEAQGFIVAKLDRLTRSVRDLGTLLHHYFEKDYSLFVVQEQVDTRTASGRLLLNLLTSVAQWERETIGERTRDALAAKRKRGEKTGGDVPFGYNAAKDGKLVENRQEQAVIEQVKILRKKGYGYKKIAGALNDLGYRTKQGKLWSHVTAGRLVRKIEDGRH
jgi:DNA invertase Pin-like site-specific DNA recombinase